MKRASQTLDVVEMIGDLAADYLASKGRGAQIGPVLAVTWEGLVRHVLTGDPRFVESSSGTFELATVRDARHAAMMSEPEPVAGSV